MIDGSWFNLGKTGLARRIMILCGLAVLFFFVVSGTGMAAKQFLFQGLIGQGHMMSDAFIWFTQEVQALTGGEIQFDVYTAGGLGIKGSQVLRAVANRELEVATANGSHIAGDMKIAEIMELPFLVPCDVPLREKVVDAMWPYWELEFEKQGVKLLGAAQIECRNIYTSEPIQSLDDLEGLRIRSQGPAESNFTNAIGANAVTVEWNDVYSALQQGVIDGYWVTNSATYIAKLYEVANAAYEVQFGGATAFLLMNKEAYDNLEPIHKAVFREAGLQAGDLIWKRVNSDDQTYKRRLMEEHGFTYTQPAPEQRDFMKEQARPIWKNWAEDVGPKGEEMVQKIRTIVNEHQSAQ